MLNYVIRRLLLAGVTLVLITFVTYGLIRSMPGTPLTLDESMNDPRVQIDDAERKRLEASYGLDKPWPIGYAQWVFNLSRGDMGRSFHLKQPIGKVIFHRIGNSLLLSIPSFLLAYILAVPIGLYSTARSGTLDERITSTILYMLYSVPTFVAGLLSLVVFYSWLGDTPFRLEPGMVSGDYAKLSYFGKIGDILWHMILPVTCLTYGSLAYYSRFVKSNMEETIRQDYIRTARAKGATWFSVLVHHAFRNTLIPFVTMLGLTLPGLVGGAVILEVVFNWPGMGTLVVEAITWRDYPLIMADTFIIAVLTLMGQLVADLLYAVVDPRIVYS